MHKRPYPNQIVRVQSLYFNTGTIHLYGNTWQVFCWQTKNDFVLLGHNVNGIACFQAFLLIVG